MRRSLKISIRPGIFRMLVFAFAMSIFGCTQTGNSGSGDVLVRVYDRYLYESDLQGIVPPGTSVRDSLTIVRSYIQNWVDKELIVKKAKENLPDELKDFSAQIDEYRNSLIIFEYEKMLVRQELDTNISFNDVNEYYEKYRQNFILKDDIIDIRYLILHKDSPAVRKFRQYIVSEVQEEKDSLALYASKYTDSFSLIEGNWTELTQLSEILPVESYSYSDFTRNNRFLEVSDSAYIYMIYIRDFKPADSISPVQFVDDDIRNMILNKRKNELVKNMRQTVLQDAIEHNQVEIY